MVTARHMINKDAMMMDALFGVEIMAAFSGKAMIMNRSMVIIMVKEQEDRRPVYIKKRAATHQWGTVLRFNSLV